MYSICTVSILYLYNAVNYTNVLLLKYELKYNLVRDVFCDVTLEGISLTPDAAEIHITQIPVQFLYIEWKYWSIPADLYKLLLCSVTPVR